MTIGVERDFLQGAKAKYEESVEHYDGKGYQASDAAIAQAHVLARISMAESLAKIADSLESVNNKLGNAYKEGWG